MGMELTKKLVRQEGSYRIENSRCAADLAALCGQMKQYIQQDALVVIWQMQKIVWGRWEAGQIVLSDGEMVNADYIMEMRAFNSREELHFVRQADAFAGRYICDGTGEAGCYVDSISRLWGEKASSQNGFVTLEDKERKLKMTVPCDDGLAAFYGLVTRNYMQADEETGQAGYTDYRYLAIEPAEGGK